MTPFKNPRTLFAASHDIVAVLAAWYAAYLLRFNLDIPRFYVSQMIDSLIIVMPVQAILFLEFGLYRGIWKYASLPDLKKIALAVGTGTAAIPTLMYMVHHPVGVPRSVFILYPILLLLVMGGSRLLYRAWKEKHLHGFARLGGKPVLVLGAGDAAASLVKSLERSADWRVVGLLDDDPMKQARMIHGIRVLGRTGELGKICKNLSVENAIIAMPDASHNARRRALELCSAAGVKALTVPSFDDLIGGKLTISHIRNVELDDLLGRNPIQLDSDGLQDFLTGKTVMVTGAGGSIGSELCRQITKFAPGNLILFDSSEFSLYTIEQEFRSSFPNTPIICTVGDVKNEARIAQVIEYHKPEILFHAAAYKHVPLMEENAWEAVRNNVFGTYVVAKAAKEHAIRKFVLISTDKAVNPTNVMGTTKRLAELVCQSLQEPEGTRFVMVRFGNVLGSTGSVIPKFKAQIEKGGPVTVTHPEITRYFMSIPEAAQLVLQAGYMSQGGEIFVLDMGEPVKIADLARDLIRLSGFNDGDIEIVYTGLRPGEKLFEELLADDEQTLPTPHPKLRIAQARREDEAWLTKLLAWLSTAEIMSDGEVRHDLAEWVPEYTPSGE